MISAMPDSATVVAKKVDTKVPTVVYKQPGKSSTLDVTAWGMIGGKPAFLLPEEPAFGATIDLNVPAGAYEDVYGNTNDALTVADNYLYSYGYTYEDVIGTYDVDLVSDYDGALPTESGIIIEKDPESDGLLIKNLLSSGTVLKGVFNPMTGTITVANGQVLLEDIEFSVGVSDIIFYNDEGSGPVIFNVPSPGLITSTQVWAYVLIDVSYYYDVFTSSTWTRTSTDTSIPVQASPAAINELISLDKTGKKLNR